MRTRLTERQGSKWWASTKWCAAHAPAPLSSVGPQDVMFCWSQREDEEDWFMPMHPTGSKNFKNLAIEAQKVMKRCVSLGLARALPSTGPADNCPLTIAGRTQGVLLLPGR